MAAAKSSEVQLSEQMIKRLKEARWIIFALLAVYLAIVLIGYHHTDPAWSTASATTQVENPGGRFGAWLSDVLLYLFGRSAWWWVVFLGLGLSWATRWLRHYRPEDRRSIFVVIAGFLLTLLASCALEAMRFYNPESNLPYASGGLVGLELGKTAVNTFGFTGASLLLLALIAAGISIFSGLSWLKIAELIGTVAENSAVWIYTKYWEWIDRRAGREKAEARAETVRNKRQKTAAQKSTPLRIEPVVVEVPKAKKIQVERQSSLFGEQADLMPPISLLDEPSNDIEPPSAESLEFTSRLIESKLADFGVEVKVLAAYPGPVITRYEIEPAIGVKGSQVMNLAKDLARALSMLAVRVVETVPGKSCMALELPNPKRQTVRLSEIISSAAYQDPAAPLTVVLGKDIGGHPVVADLAKMPHLLVAGTTGSGKSVGVNAMIMSLLYKSPPDKVRLIMVDPKMLELSVYEDIPHLLTPVVTDMRNAGNALNWCVEEMERRYKLMAAVGVRNLAGFNKQISDAKKNGKPIKNPFSISPENPEPLETLPHIVVVVDEFADLMMVVGKKIEELIARLAQKARAAGVHLILATQRPSVDVITGLIKANIPTRMAFQVSSKIDSRTILDQMGAENLLGMGDMLYLAPGTGLPVRIHGAFVSDEEVHKVVAHLKAHGQPDYVEGILTAVGGEGDLADGFGAQDVEADPLYDQAVQIVLQSRRASISLVQRHLRIGYNRAARLIEQMESAGIVSAMGSNGSREVLAPSGSGE